ncbi:hypothetical protein P5673_013711, partial [Acropora cervicornis]
MKELRVGWSQTLSRKHNSKWPTLKQRSWDHQCLLECVFQTIQVLTLYDFKVRVFVFDGASAILALIKLLCGHKRKQLPLCDGEDPFAVTASFQNPYEDQPRDKRVFVVVCPSHQ